MSKKKKAKPVDITDEELHEIVSSYNQLTTTDAEYSLEIDPLKKYNFTDEQIDFIRYYSEFKNFVLVADMMGCGTDEVVKLYNSPHVIQELFRLNRARYHNMFATKMLDVEQLGGYLTALLTDQVPIADRINSSEKLRVVNSLLQIQQLRREALDDPSLMTSGDISTQIKDLSVEAIKNLLAVAEKDKAIDVEVVQDTLSEEDKTRIENMSTDEILKELNTLTEK